MSGSASSATENVTMIATSQAEKSTESTTENPMDQFFPTENEEKDDIEEIIEENTGNLTGGFGTQDQLQTLDEMKNFIEATDGHVNVLITSVNEEFDNKILMVQQATERAVVEAREYGNIVMTRIQNERNAFTINIEKGMKEFKKLQARSARNISCLEFIQNQFSNTIRETGLIKQDDNPR